MQDRMLSMVSRGYPTTISSRYVCMAGEACRHFYEQRMRNISGDRRLAGCQTCRHSTLPYLKLRYYDSLQRSENGHDESGYAMQITQRQPTARYNSFDLRWKPRGKATQGKDMLRDTKRLRGEYKKQRHTAGVFAERGWGEGAHDSESHTKKSNKYRTWQ